MTNIYVRIQRDDGSFDNVQINEMTDTELQRFIDDKCARGASVQEAWNWVKVLAAWIRDNVNQIA